VPDRRLLAVLVAALAFAARLPFLVTGKMPFDSDEAVEGLMARHVLDGELPAFFWGQAFKGVPEVYASAAAFALFGPSVAVLKGVTLVLFGLYAGLSFVLLDRLTNRWFAACATLLLIASPPALVFWSLNGSAEYVVVMLLGTILLLLSLQPRYFAIGLTIGAGLWVHQLFAVYLIPLGIILLLKRPSFTAITRADLNRFAVALGAVAGVYFLLGTIAFFTGGFAVQLGPVLISATAPQKMARISIAVLALAALVQVATTTPVAQSRRAIRRYWPAAAGVLVGYAPALLYSLLVEPARSPARVANLRQLIAAAPDVFGNIFPILAGFKTGTTERVAVPLAAAVPGVAALTAYAWSLTRRFREDFFALFVFVVPVLFFASGAYLDTQSYRYFIPWYAGLSVAWVSGSLIIARGRKGIATALVVAIAGVHVWQQVSWYQMLQPDTRSLSTIECLRRNGIRGGYAEYWTAYKLTFIAQENIIIAPTDGIDRYPKYTEFVRSLPQPARMDDAAGCN
jgi:hypothetical protein